MDLKIDPEFQKVCCKLKPAELTLLEKSILEDGCREPICVWNGTIVDGHNRYDICQRHGVEFDTRKLSFPDKQHALLWIIANQAGRRNLSPPKYRQLMGRYYLIQKDLHEHPSTEGAPPNGGRRKSSNGKGKVYGRTAQNPNGRPSKGRESAIAETIKVFPEASSPRRCRENAETVQALDKLDRTVRKLYDNDDIHASDAAVRKLAELTPAQQRAIATKARTQHVPVANILRARSNGCGKPTLTDSQIMRRLDEIGEALVKRARYYGVDYGDPHKQRVLHFLQQTREAFQNWQKVEYDSN